LLALSLARSRSRAELGPTAEPLINAALPKPLKNFKFLRSELGHDYLVVDRVTVHKRYKDAIAMDLDISFTGKPDIMMKVSPLAGSFGIEELRWSGRLSVLMRPLTTTLPCIGAIQAAFVDHPDIYLNFSGAAAFADIGPVEKVVRKVMRDVVASMFVLPNRFLFKLNDAVDFFDVYYPPLGALEVTIVEGRGFVKDKKAGLIKTTPDLYAGAKFGLVKTKTKVDKSLTPKFDHSHLFLLNDDGA
jgi:Ca2+-dependent lipid-binding protein